VYKSYLMDAVLKMIFRLFLRRKRTLLRTKMQCCIFSMSRTKIAVDLYPKTVWSMVTIKDHYNNVDDSMTVRSITTGWEEDLDDPMTSVRGYFIAEDRFHEDFYYIRCWIFRDLHRYIDSKIIEYLKIKNIYLLLQFFIDLLLYRGDMNYILCIEVFFSRNR